jgi:ubiquinone/menaquinone biosynthesis C-methylase UbiE
MRSGGGGKAARAGEGGGDVAHVVAADLAGAVRGRSMEGMVAAWYARASRVDAADFQRTAGAIAARVPAGAHVLEVAPGPGYLAIALAQRGDCTVEAVDISHSFIRIATRNAARAGVSVTFRHGDVHALPFAAEHFDALVCRAAFKNFARPAEALREMRRVLRREGSALVIDLRADVTDAEIDDCVTARGQGWLTSMMIGRTLKGMLRRRAYTADQFRGMADAAGFAGCDITRASIGFEAWIRR